MNRGHISHSRKTRPTQASRATNPRSLHRHSTVRRPATSLRPSRRVVAPSITTSVIARWVRTSNAISAVRWPWTPRGVPTPSRRRITKPRLKPLMWISNSLVDPVEDRRVAGHDGAQRRPTSAFCTPTNRSRHQHPNAVHSGRPGLRQPCLPSRFPSLCTPLSRTDRSARAVDR
jgi:hypothetical protein